MTDEGGIGDNRLYLIIAIFILLVVFFALIWFPPQFTPASVSDEFLVNGWSEDLDERSCGSQSYGVDKWCSLTYKIDDNHPAYLTVTTFKTLIIMTEEDLEAKTIETIREKALLQGISINNNTEITGERTLQNGHKTKYVIYDGNDTSKDPMEKIKIIGEVWNCGTSGNSIICIGVAQVTDNFHNNSEVDLNNWKKIVEDGMGMIDGFIGDNGLIFNVKCH